MEDLGQSRQRAPQVDLYAEQYEVREAAKRNLYHRQDLQLGGQHPTVLRGARQSRSAGHQPPATSHQPAARRPPVAQAPTHGRRPPTGRRGFRAGAMIRHPKYGRGTVLRREGDGEDAKLTVSFPGYGLKKLVEKYAGIQEE